jgi:hypothetical protein
VSAPGAKMPELDKGDGLSRRNQRKVVVEAATASSTSA